MPGFKRDIRSARHFGLALLLTLLALLPLEWGFHQEVAVGDGLEESENRGHAGD
jgi:hypothetical protein